MSITAKESEFELLRFRLFLYSHMRLYLDSYKRDRKYRGSDISSLYSLVSCGYKSVYKNYINALLYFDYNKVGFFTKKIKFDKNSKIIGNECEILRQSQNTTTFDIMTNDPSFKKRDLSEPQKKKLQKKCTKEILLQTMWLN